MTDVKPFHQRLRELRAKLNLSQEQLASRLNVSFQTVNRWESGNVKPQKAQLEAVEKLMEEAGIHNDGENDSGGGETNAVQPRRRRGVSKSSVLSTKSMEQMLWDAACSIRGRRCWPCCWC